MKFSHLSRAIHNDLFDLPFHPMLLAAQKAHGWREVQRAIVRGLVQGLSDASHRLDFNPFSGLQIQAFRGLGFVGPAPICAQENPADSPEKPYPDSMCHFQDVAVAAADFAKTLSKSFPPRQLSGRFQ